MSGRFDEKVVVVTGGSSGIGAACAVRFAKEGALVSSVALHLPPTGGADRQNVTDLVCDVSDERAVSVLINGILDRHGRIDVLVNSAGIGGEEQVRLHEMSFSNWDRVQSVNVRGAFAVMRAVIPAMLRQGKGSIVNIASIGSFRATTHASAYLASKGAMLMLTRAAAVEYATDNIRINAVCPSTTNTAILAGLEPERLERLVARHPQGRLGEPEEVAALVAFIASDEAPHMTGGSYLIDGGRSAS
jgi:NAD(P)-dependent dehydrogenase (short-subunit alcohol dehydrogenase family)